MVTRSRKEIMDKYNKQIKNEMEKTQPRPIRAKEKRNEIEKKQG